MKLRLPNKLIAAIVAAAACAPQALAFVGPDVTYTGEATVTSDNMNPTLTVNTTITVDSGVTKDTGNIGINGTGYNAKLIAYGDNTTLDLGKMTADSVWLTNGRYRINDAVTADTHVFNGVTTVYAGGAQLWFGDNANYTGANAITSNFVLGTALFHENIGSLDYAALRISKTTEINGDVTIDAEGSKIGFQGNNNLTLRGALKGSGNLRLDTYSDSPTLYLQGDTSEYTGSMTVANANITLNFGGGTEETPKIHTIHGINSTGTVDIAGNTTLKLLASETQDFSVAIAKLRGDGGTLALGVDVEGPTVVTGGTVKLTSADASDKKTFSQVTVDSGATLILQDVSANTKSGDQNLKGNLTIGSGATFTVNHTDSLWYSAGTGAANTITVLSGGELAFGNKRWTVGANNKIVLAGGTITGQGDGAGALDFYVNNGVLSATENSTVSAKIRLRNANQTTTFNVAGTKTLTVSGGILGGGNLLKSGEGTLKLSANNHSAGVSGNFTINEGTLLMGNSLALGKYNYGTNATNRTITVNSNGTLDVGGLEGAQEQAYHITLNGGTLTNSGNNVGSNQRQVIVGATLTADSSIDSDRNFGMIAHSYGATALNLGTYTLEKLGTGAFYITHATVSGTGTVKVSGGTLEFGSKDNSCTFSDAVTLMTTGGTMKLDINSANSFLQSGGKVSVSGGTFELGANGLAVGDDHFTANFELSGGETKLMTHNGSDGTIKNYDGTLTMTDGAKLTLHDGSAKFNGAISLNGTVNLTANWAKSGMEFAGAMTGTGTVYMRNNGNLEGRHSQKFTISGADNEFSGTIVVGQDSSGSKGELTELIVKNGTALQNAVVDLAAGNKAEMQLAAESITLAGLKGSNGSNVHKGSMEAATLTLNTAEGKDYTYSGGGLSGISLVKSGSGSQTMNGSAAYELGAVSVTGGALNMAANASATTLSITSGTLDVGAGKRFALTTATGDADYSGVTGSGTFAVTLNSGNNGVNSKVTMGNAYTGTLEVNGHLNSQSQLGGVSDVQFNNNAALVFAHTTTNLNGATLENNTDNFSSHIKLTSGANFKVITWGAAHNTHDNVISGNLSLINGNATLDKQDGGKLIISGSRLNSTGHELSIVNHNGEVTLDSVHFNGRVNLGKSGDNGNAINMTSGATAKDATAEYSMVAWTDINMSKGNAAEKAVFDFSRSMIAILSGKTVHVGEGVQLKTDTIKMSDYSNNGYITLDAGAELSATGTVKVQKITNSGEVTLSGANKTVESYSQSGSSALLHLGSNTTLETAIAENGTLEGSLQLDADAHLTIKELERATTANLNNLVLADGAVLSGYTASAIDAAQEATINVAGTLTAESGANLNANLTFSQGAKVDITGENGLHMGSTVTFTQDNGLLLTGSAADTLASFTLAGQSLTLFSGVDTFIAGTTRYTTETVKLDVNDYFNLADSKYDFVREHLVLKYEGNAASDGGTLSLWMETPEPATATLSLLALAALAARRKRK